MATAVTLKESDGSEIYPVTDISLVNNGIHAVDIEATTPVPAVETAMIADGAVTSAKIADGTIATGDIANGAVTNAKIDWSTVPSTYTDCTTTGAQKTPSNGTCKICKIGKIVNLQVNYNYNGSKVFDLTDLGDVIIADIPAGYRPPFNIYGAAMVKCSSSTVGTNQVNQIHLWINSTGSLLINNMGNGALTGINAIRGNLTWFVA